MQSVGQVIVLVSAFILSMARALVRPQINGRTVAALEASVSFRSAPGRTFRKINGAIDSMSETSGSAIQAAIRCSCATARVMMYPPPSPPPIDCDPPRVHIAAGTQIVDHCRDRDLSVRAEGYPV